LHHSVLIVVLIPLKYDIIPNLVCMTGRIVESTDYTERVLWDIRSTVSEFTLQNFFLHFKEKCHQQGFLLASEPYGTGSFDGPEVAKLVDLKMTEFWIRDTPWFRRNLWEWTGQIVSSAAHLTGDHVVGAEAFTRMNGDWAVHPYNLKIKGDRAFTNGVNRYIFHSSVHQPWNDDVKPGFTMGQFGTQFHRNNTWFFEIILAKKEIQTQHPHTKSLPGSIDPGRFPLTSILYPGDR
jgi:hypothetical protein